MPAFWARYRLFLVEPSLIIFTSSQYGKMTEESLDEFLAENDLSFLELADELELPSIARGFQKKMGGQLLIPVSVAAASAPHPQGSSYNGRQVG